VPVMRWTRLTLGQSTSVPVRAIARRGGMLAVDEFGRRLFSLAVRPGEQRVVGGQRASGVGAGSQSG